jgi:hypothetical protein
MTCSRDLLRVDPEQSLSTQDLEMELGVIEWVNRRIKKKEMIFSILRARDTFFFFIPLLFFEKVNEVLYFILDPSCIPLDEYHPKGKEKPDD